MVSTGRSVPSAVTIECGRTSVIRSVTTSTCGSCSAWYQSLDIRIRLQPIGSVGVSFARRAGSATVSRRCLRYRALCAKSSRGSVLKPSERSSLEK
jgi:hypothetical protein